jgi:hypothetical protein
MGSQSSAIRFSASAAIGSAAICRCRTDPRRQHQRAAPRCRQEGSLGASRPRLSHRAAAPLSLSLQVSQDAADPLIKEVQRLSRPAGVA